MKQKTLWTLKKRTVFHMFLPCWNALLYVILLQVFSLSVSDIQYILYTGICTLYTEDKFFLDKSIKNTKLEYTFPKIGRMYIMSPWIWIWSSLVFSQAVKNFYSQIYNDICNLHKQYINFCVVFYRVWKFYNFLFC